MRKRWRVIWIVCLAICFLSGCQGGQTGEDRTDGETSESAEPARDAAHLVITYQTLPTSVIRDLEDVTEEINRITVPEIGVEIEFRPVDATAAFTEYSLWISKGEQVDLMMLNYQDITTYVNRKMLLPLDGLLEKEGQDIVGLEDEGIYLTEGSVVKNAAYGVAVVPDYAGNGVGLWVAEALVKKTGLPYEKEHVYTLEELGDFFARCKELYPESYPLGQITAGSTTSSWLYFGGRQTGLGGDSLSGILAEDGEVVNLYETKEYIVFLKWLRECYEQGYIYPDAAFTDSYLEELIAGGIVLTYPWASAPGYSREAFFGEKTVCLRTSRVTVGRQHSKSGFWTIPVTSGNPEAAMRFLNLLYADVRITNLIQYGIASRHYVVLDVETGRIGYPYGVSIHSTGYYNPLGLYGDRRRIYTFDSPGMLEEKRVYEQEALENREEPLSFCFDSEQVGGELAAVQKVVEKYVPVLESGSVDIEPWYREFILELKMAGINAVIQEKQRQYDLWLESEQEAVKRLEGMWAE